MTPVINWCLLLCGDKLTPICSFCFPLGMPSSSEIFALITDTWGRREREIERERERGEREREREGGREGGREKS